MKAVRMNSAGDSGVLEYTDHPDPVPGPGQVLEASRTIELFHLPRSIKIGYASFLDHIRTPERLRKHAQWLFEQVREGRLQVFDGGSFPLADSARAHDDLWNRRTTGKLVLIPQEDTP